MTSLVVRGRDNAIVERHTMLVEYDPEAISRGVDIEIAAKWAYDLKGSGKGVGVRGAEEGVRLLSSYGEIIRVESCVLVSHDEQEAFFNATATRYVINPETGDEVRLDSQIRGKRVSKWQEHNDQFMQEHPTAPRFYLNPNWYELGVVKASRNAALALMPSNVKSALLKAGLDAADKVEAERRAGSRGGTSRSNSAPPKGRQSTAARATPAADDAQLVKEIERVVLDTKNTWDGGSWLTFYQQLREKFAPKGAAQFDAKAVETSRLQECLDWMHERRGDRPGGSPQVVDAEVVSEGGEAATE